MSEFSDEQKTLIEAARLVAKMMLAEGVPAWRIRQMLERLQAGLPPDGED